MRASPPAFRSRAVSNDKTQELPLWHHDPCEILAAAMEASFFAPHELPVDRHLHAKFRHAARAAIGVLKSDE